MACRHLWRSRLYAFITVTGLALGLTCVLLATLFVRDEHSFDQFHSEHLFRINSRIVRDGKTEMTGTTGQVQGPAFKAEVPEVLSFARIMGGAIYEDVRTKDKALRLQILFVDETFFDVFNFRLKSGDARVALKNVSSVVITEKTAIKFFGRADVVGELLHMDYEPSARRIGTPLVVSGVVHNPPANSSVQFDILFSFKFLQTSFDDHAWLNSYLGTFVLLHPDANVNRVEQKFNQLHAVHAKEQIDERRRSRGGAPAVTYQLQRMADIHLNPQQVSDKTGEDGVVNGSKPVYSYLFLGLSLFILLMASINFINISMGHSMKRMKEIGVRKVAGGAKYQIIVQFLGESTLLCALGFLLSLLFTYLLLPVFNQLSDKQIPVAELLDGGFLSWAILILLGNVLISGLYPAWLLSGVSPIEILYQRQRFARKNLLGNILVTFQFSTAILLGICSIIFYQQMHFIESKDLGYNPDQVIRVKIPGLSDTKRMAEYFKMELGDDQHIKGLSATGEMSPYDTRVNGSVVKTYYRTIDADYLPVLGIRLKEGRNFSPLFPSDKKLGVLVNEAFVKASNITKATGTQIKSNPDFGNDNLTIVGVVKNFHSGSFKEAIKPMVMVMSEEHGGDAILVKIDAIAAEQVIARLRRVFQKLLPGAVFDYTFLDEQNASLYRQEIRWQRIIGYATWLSALICCLGLFALAHLATAQRAHETGIRVVLGAAVSDIVFLFSKDFLKLVIVAIFVASPFAYYFMNLWLAAFAYRINIDWRAFALAGFVSVLVALVTVGSQAMRSATMNPADTFRTRGD
jgi:putative ABC transport system permease protein